MAKITGIPVGGLGGGSGLLNIVEDLTPQLGGNLDLNGNVITGLEIGTDLQAFDAGLLSISGLITAADKMIFTTASDTYAVTDLTGAGRALIDDADNTAQQVTLGLIIGTDVQAWSAVLDGTTASYTTAEETKLDGIEPGAEVNTVDDVFGRTGNVVAVASDYDASQIDNDSTIPGDFVDDALDFLDNINWDIQNAVFRSQTDVSADNDEISGFYMSDDGTKMYVSRFGNDSLAHVDEYTLSIPYDETSKTKINTMALSPEGVKSNGIHLSKDLTRLYSAETLASGNGKFHEWTMTVAGDLGTETFSVTKDVSADLSSGSLRDFTLARNDTRLYVGVTEVPNHKVFQYNFGTAGSLATITKSKEFDVSAQVANIIDVAIKDDGTTMWVMDDTTNKIYQYSLPDPYEVDSAIFDNISFDVSVVVTTLTSMFFRLHGSTVYITDSDIDDIVSFSISTEDNNAFTDDEKTKLAGISYAERTASAKQTITGSGALVLAHNLPGIPTLWYVILENKETEHNFSPGDQTRPSAIQSSSNDQGVGIVPDGSDLDIRYGSGFGGGSSVFSVVDQITGDVEIITNSKWEAIFVAAL